MPRLSPRCLTCLLLLILPHLGLRAAAESTTPAPPEVAASAAEGEAHDPDDDFAPMLGAFALVAILVILVVIGFGVALGLAVALLLALLTAWGVVTVSALTGAATGSARTAARAFVLQVGGLLGIPSGAALGLMGWWLFDLPGRWGFWAGAGGLAGAAGGLALAYAFDLACRAIRNRLRHPTAGAAPAQEG